jgi:hypothetical protein
VLARVSQLAHYDIDKFPFKRVFVLWSAEKKRRAALFATDA